MCGIGLVVQPLHGAVTPSANGHAAEGSGGRTLLDRHLMSRRGPDLYGEHQVQVDTSTGQRLQLHFAASLLQLRGSQPATVPLLDADSADCLCFNGEVFGGLDVPQGHNDGVVLFQALRQAPGDMVPALLSSLRGPWSIIYWRPSAGTVWFGRDFMGRRSLLVHYPGSGTCNSGASSTQLAEADCFALTSVAPASTVNAAAEGERQAVSSGAPATRAPQPEEEGEDSEVQDSAAFWQELPPGIYSLQLHPVESASFAPEGHGGSQEQAQEGSSGERSVAPAAAGAALGLWGVRLESHAWADPLVQRLFSYAKVPSGCCEAMRECGTTHSTQQPDRPLLAERSALAAAAEGDAQLVTTAASVTSAMDPAVPRSLGTTWTLDTATDSLLHVLQAAVRIRCCALDTVQLCSTSEASVPPLSPPRTVMILFSGGVDSVLLAALAHRSLPLNCQLDLCNVCFDCGRSPDRLSAQSALAELAAWAPERKWRLVEVDATLQDTYTHRDHLLALLHPAGTVMDLNIGAALWLAASGTGNLRLAPSQAAQEDPEHSSASSASLYCSPARIVLLGHGADEQCAGYGRHRTRFRLHGGDEGLAAELRMDVKRMWLRNCGRDDRLVADRGREARHPFLDEQLMALILDLPLQCIADLRLQPGVGDKKLLRNALHKIGLPEAAARVKRAIQFGSRIGKQSNRQEFGSNRAANRVNAGSLALSQLPKHRA